LIQIKQLPCIKQFEHGKRLQTIITMTNNLTDMIFSCSSAISFEFDLIDFVMTKFILNVHMCLKEVIF